MTNCKERGLEAGTLHVKGCGLEPKWKDSGRLQLIDAQSYSAFRNLGRLCFINLYLEQQIHRVQAVNYGLRLLSRPTAQQCTFQANQAQRLTNECHPSYTGEVMTRCKTQRTPIKKDGNAVYWTSHSVTLTSNFGKGW